MNGLSLPPRRDPLREMQHKLLDLLEWVDAQIAAEAEAEEAAAGYQSGRRLRSVKSRLTAPRSAP